MKFFLFLLFIIPSTIFANDLKISTVKYSFNKLIKLASESIKTDDPTYKGKVSFKAIPFEKIMSVPKYRSVKFKARDGFTSIIPGSYFHGKSKAFLAIEQKKWPEIRKGATAGPYYLIWSNPKSSKIKQEQWPYQISEISIVENVESLYEEIIPDYLSQSARRGFKVFAQNCFACHKINGYGEGSIGPDLNVPMNPTEYFKLSALKKLIRNPRSVRKWKGMVMPKFDEKTISNKDLVDLIKYLIEIKELKQNKPI